MKIPVFNIEGKETGKKADLKDSIFGIEPNDHAIYLDVKHYMSNNRQGTHKTKERAEITGSTRKIKRQKGTGTARAGSIKNPLFRGGGKIFGPRPKDYNFKLNKKVKQLARKSALTYKAKSNSIIVLEDFSLEAPKTREFVDIRKNLNIDGKKSLLVLHEHNRNITLASRNIQDSKIIIVNNLNTYDIMNSGVLVFMESSLGELQSKE
jgi:large subunit ribosomal protein L4